MSFLDDFDWKSALKTIAPTVAGIFGTPLAGAGVSALLEAIFPTEDVRNLPPAAAEQKLAAALHSGLTPEQLAAMKKADYDFQQRIAELGLEELKVDAGDRDSARKREIEVKDRMPSVLATVSVVGLFVTLIGLFFLVPPEENRDIVYLIIGQAVTSTFMMVFSYYFGSSAQGRVKTNIIADAAQDMRNKVVDMAETAVAKLPLKS